MEHFDSSGEAVEYVFKDFGASENAYLEVSLPLNDDLTLDELHDALDQERLSCCGYDEMLATVGESRTVYFYAWSWGH